MGVPVVTVSKSSCHPVSQGTSASEMHLAGVLLFSVMELPPSPITAGQEGICTLRYPSRNTLRRWIQVEQGLKMDGLKRRSVVMTVDGAV